MVLANTADREAANGNPHVFDAEWEAALATGDVRWLSYPAASPRTQVELFERVKADQIDALLARHGLRRGRVLEYACGSAGMSVYLARRGFDVVAADLSRNGLRLAGRNAERHAADQDHLGLAGADAYSLPFPDGAFDLVMSYGLLEHFTPEQLAPLLCETNRVLRPGGLHVVDIIHGRCSVRTLASYAHFLASAGARVARGRLRGLGAVYRSYLKNYYENRLGPDDWRRLFVESGLKQVGVHTCRPFPLLALSGGAEQLYLGLLRLALPLWRWYDQTDSRPLRWLGWMYLVYGVKGGR